MDQTYHFTLESHLEDSSEGDGTVILSTGAAAYGVPPQFGGKPDKTSPEELIMAALSSCFSITMGFLFEKRKIPVSNFTMHAECQVDRIKGKLSLTSITLKPHITLAEDNKTNGSQIEKDILAAIERAKQVCLISNALQGNVELKVNAEIE